MQPDLLRDDTAIVHLNIRVSRRLRQDFKAFCALKGFTLADGLQNALDAWQKQSSKTHDAQIDGVENDQA